MTQQQFDILRDSPYLSLSEFMIIYQVKKSTAQKIKRNLKLKVFQNNPDDYNRFPPNGKLPTIYMLKKNFLPFTLEDLKIFIDLHNKDLSALEIDTKECYYSNENISMNGAREKVDADVSKRT